MTHWDKLKIFALPIAIVVAAMILVMGMRPHPRWEIATGSQGSVFLLDRITGAVFFCVNPKMVLLNPAEMDCDPK